MYLLVEDTFNIHAQCLDIMNTSQERYVTIRFTIYSGVLLTGDGRNLYNSNFDTYDKTKHVVHVFRPWFPGLKMGMVY
jgi:hypothetical protein